MLASGVAAAIATISWAIGILARPTPCLDAAVCGADEAAVFLTYSTTARQPPAELLAEGFRSLTAVTLGLGLLVVAMVGLNLATLLLARSGARTSGFALRAALGATPGRIAGAVARESLPLLAGALVMGAALGLAGAVGMRAAWPLESPPWTPLAGSWYAAGAVAVVLSLVLAICYLWPARIAWRRRLRASLPGNGQATPGPAEAMGRNALAVIQFVAALVLLVGAGLLLRAFAPGAGADASTQAGAAETLVARLRLPPTGNGPDAVPGRSAELQEILRRVRLVPGVTDSSLATEGSWAGIGVRDDVTALCLECWLGYMPKQYTTRPARIHSVSAGFLERQGLSLRRGRWLTGDDRPGEPEVAVISNAFAIHLFPNGDPVGKEIRFGGIGGKWVRVVGVVDDLRVPGLAAGALPEPAVYLSILQHPPASASLLVHGSPGATGLEASVRTAATAAVPGVRLREWTALAELLARQRAPLRWFAAVYAALAAVLVVVAGWGLHELIAYGVRRRTRELGVRMALGADGRRIVRMVTGQTLRQGAVGMVVGLIPLSGLARFLQLQVQGVDPWDLPLTLGVAGALALVAVMASYHPARRAAAVDPQVTMREW